MDGILRMAKRGFTLIEVMIAMVILSIGLMAVLKMTYVYIASNTTNLRAGKASVLAQDKMEELRALARTDSMDNFLPFDFDYLVSTNAAFTSVTGFHATGSSAAIPISGMLSGAAGTPQAVYWHAAGSGDPTQYDVLYDDASHGDATSGDNIYTAEDTQYAIVSGSALPITRRWTVEPLPSGGTPEFAKITVTAEWKEEGQGTTQTRSMSIMSLVHRRQ